MSKNIVQDMKDMYQKYGFDTEEFDKAKLTFRMSLLTEEYVETMYNFKKGVKEEIVDGLIDLVVIAIGTLNLAGVDTHKAWDEVFNSNMSKERGIKPGREDSGGFDIIKPEGFKPADHTGNHGKLVDIYPEEV